MFKPTHTVVGISEDNSLLKQAAILGEFRPGMEIIAWCTNPSDADIVRRTWQEMHNEQYYFVIETKS